VTATPPAQQASGTTAGSTEPSIDPAGAAARGIVLKILEGNNACSEFFNNAATAFTGGGDGAPSAAAIFSQISIRRTTNLAPLGLHIQQKAAALRTLFL
jgi:hypothetical protein